MWHFVSDDVLQLSSQLCLDKDITRVEKTLCTDALSVSDSINFFGWNKNL
jgi:hypothetical protein